MLDFEGMNAARARLVEGLAKVERAITELDLACKEAWEAFDMWSFIGQDVPMKIYLDERPIEEAKLTYEKDPAIMPPKLNVRVNGKWTPADELEDTVELPLVRYENNHRIEIGTAKVHTDGTIDAIVNLEGAGFVALPDPSEYSFFTDPDEAPKRKWWAARVTIPREEFTPLHEEEK
jgi:hypothetical protein